MQPTLDGGQGAASTIFDAHGDSDFAFGWSHLPHVKLWQQARCA